MTTGERMGWLRVAVGLATILIPPSIVARSSGEQASPTAAVLLRTIGVRDLALGLGAVGAARSHRDDDLHHWTLLALVSDALDVAAGLIARGATGARDSRVAAGLSALAVVGDVHVLRRT